jgi:hypothetical protein
LIAWPHAPAEQHQLAVAALGGRPFCHDDGSPSGGRRLAF